jgi:4-amino-4-deoxy-L-arabinose transferase-like glycosyltransferase
MDGLIYAAIGKNAAEKGTWLLPSMSETMFSSFRDHIPFMLILEGVFFKVFGASFLTARLFVNFFSYGTFLSIIYFTRKNATTFQVVLSVFVFLLSYPVLRHSRHPNFDMALMLTCFLSINFYIQAIEYNLKRDWYLTGIFFGLAMLFKGPMAIFIPATIFVHFVTTKRLALLLRPLPWLSLLAGFAIFSIWPLALLSIGQFAAFSEWFHFTIINSIMGSRGVTSNDYFCYVRYLFMFTPINMILMLITLYKLRYKKFSEFYKVHLTFFLVVLVLTSMMKFKLSHYIQALYPSLAIIAALGFSNISRFKLQEVLLVIMLTAGSLVYFLPQDSTKTRDYEIFEVRRVLSEKNLKASKFIVEEGAYPYWSLTALMAFVDSTRVDEVKPANIKLDKANILYLILKPHQTEFASKCIFIYSLNNYRSDAYFCPR